MDKLPVKVGLITLDQPMTRKSAMRWGVRHMPADLKRAGFETFVSKADDSWFDAMSGYPRNAWYRVSYGKKV